MCKSWGIRWHLDSQESTVSLVGSRRGLPSTFGEVARNTPYPHTPSLGLILNHCQVCGHSLGHISSAVLGSFPPGWHPTRAAFIRCCHSSLRPVVDSGVKRTGCPTTHAAHTLDILLSCSQSIPDSCVPVGSLMHAYG